MRLKTYKMAMPILLKFLTLGWDISRTTWRIEINDGSFFGIFHALSFELKLISRLEFPFNIHNKEEVSLFVSCQTVKGAYFEDSHHFRTA